MRSRVRAGIADRDRESEGEAGIKVYMDREWEWNVSVINRAHVAAQQDENSKWEKGRHV